MSPISLGLFVVSIVFFLICTGVAVGALSNVQKDKTKAKTQGLTAFAFCLLGTLLFAGSKLAP